jgi:hypothetical protein
VPYDGELEWYLENSSSSHSASPSQVGRMTYVVWNEWFTVHQLQHHNVVSVEDPKPVRWEKPGVGWIKCNVMLMLRLLLVPL